MKTQNNKNEGLREMVDDLEREYDDFPEVVSFGSLMTKYKTKPASIIENVIGVGDKMILSAPSKAGKTWLLLNLAYSLQNGKMWLGHQCALTDVLYINLELSENWLAERGRLITRSMSDDVKHPDTLTLRGHLIGWRKLSEKIQEHVEHSGKKYGGIILDPIYKMLGDTEENSNGDVALLLNDLERMGADIGAAVIFSHHHSKGNKSNVEAIERMAGAGSWGRDPDAIVDLVAHDEPDCYTVEVVPRNYPRPPKKVVACQFPNFVEIDLDPDKLRSPGGSKKKITVEDVLNMLATVPAGMVKATLNRKLVTAFDVSAETARRRIVEAIDGDLVRIEGNLIINQKANPQSLSTARANH